jgi:hypothetical protein
MRVSWVIEGKGGDSVDVDSAEDGWTALRDAVRTHYSQLPTDALIGVLGGVHGLRLPMLTDGRTAVEHGREWGTSVGGILVTLSP